MSSWLRLHHRHSRPKKATTSVPIVFVNVFDPVELGLVPSLARPGENITGLAFSSADLAGKRLALLRLGMQLEQVPVRGTDDFDAGFKAMRAADGLLQANAPLFTTHRARLVGLAVKSR